MASDGMSFVAMVLVQVGYAGMNIISKLAMDSGMNPYILITYRQLFSTLAIIPFAYFLERKTRPNMTLSIFFQIFLCSIFGATANQILYFVGLNISTPTIACALSNLLPAMTFILAVPFRLENVGIKSMAGQAKVLGTIICVGGAMLLSFYNGSIIRIHESSIHWKYAEEMTKNHSGHNSNILLGSVLLILSTGAWAIWFIIQARLSEKFNAPYTSSAMMCSMASIECALIGMYSNHHIDAWSLRSSIRLITTLYAGLSSALAFCLMSWCIQRKGPLYVSVFSPLLLVLVAVLSWALLQEKLYIGTVVGSVLIVLGLYAVLWGKKNEINPTDLVKDEENGEKDVAEKDLELQFFDIIGGDLHVVTGK